MIEGDGLLRSTPAASTSAAPPTSRVWPIGRVSAAKARLHAGALRARWRCRARCFPRGTPSPMLDAIARAPLWEGLDYGHGTGHGVGYFSTCTRARRASPRPARCPHGDGARHGHLHLGLYRPGQWGIRIENLVLNVADAGRLSAEFGEFLEFETLTLCPIDTRCIDRALLRADEIAWLNDYHATVRERLEPLVSTAQRATGCSRAPRPSDAAAVHPAISGSSSRVATRTPPPHWPAVPTLRRLDCACRPRSSGCRRFFGHADRFGDRRSRCHSTRMQFVPAFMQSVAKRCRRHGANLKVSSNATRRRDSKEPT